MIFSFLKPYSQKLLSNLVHFSSSKPIFLTVLSKRDLFFVKRGLFLPNFEGAHQPHVGGRLGQSATVCIGLLK